MFHKATKSLVKELDPQGDLIPVCCSLDQSHFRPLCLVQRKKKKQWWQTCPYYKTDYRLRDVLLSGDQVPKLDLQDSSSITFHDKIDGKLEGDLSVATELATAEVRSSAKVSHAMSVKLKKIHVCHEVLSSIKGDGKINLQHEIIRQAMEFNRNLYVITEAVEVVEATQFEESNMAEGSILTKAYIRMKLQGARESKKTITIPKACILAFRVKRLLIENGYLEFSHIPDDPTGTFEKTALRADSVVSQSLAKDQYTDVKNECEKLDLLPEELHGLFLESFVAIMRDCNLLQQLEHQLEKALEGPGQVQLKVDQPELQVLVDNLQDSNGEIFTELAEPVLYFLQALDELTEFQLILLEESVARKIVSQQVTLVKNILDNGFSNKGEKFTIESPLQGEELDITRAMIELSGVKVDNNGYSISSLAGTENSDDVRTLTALYVALYSLSLVCTA